MPLVGLYAKGFDTVGLEPQRVNNCLLYIQDINLGNGETDPITMAQEAFPFPKVQLGIIPLHHLNESRNYAGRPQYQAIQFQLKEFVTADVANALHTWFYQVHDPITGMNGYAVDYKKNACAMMYGPDGSNTQQWNLYGIFPDSYDPGDAQMGGDNEIMVNIGFSVDKAISSGGLSGTVGNWPAFP